MKPLVGIIMGSKSDLPIMKEAADFFEKMQIPFEITVASAHRTPHRALKYAETAAARGIKIIIGGAGGAAHLPGVVAALTTLPVIGVPIKSNNSLSGLDSILSILQMPPGIPVATVGLNAATNAGILAARILAVSDKALAKKLKNYQKELEGKVLQTTKDFNNLGFKFQVNKFTGE